MGCSSNRIVKNQSTKYFTNNILENTKNDIDKSAPLPIIIIKLIKIQHFTVLSLVLHVMNLWGRILNLLVLTLDILNVLNVEKVNQEIIINV